MNDCRWLIKPLDKIAHELEVNNLIETAKVILDNDSSFDLSYYSWATDIIQELVHDNKDKKKEALKDFKESLQKQKEEQE